MELRRTSARRAGLVAVAALLALGASACSSGTGLVGSPPAATVNGTEISRSTLMDQIAVTQRFYEGQAEQNGGATGELATAMDQLQGSGTDAVGAEGAARVLSDLIADEVIRQDLAAHDALPTKADREAIRAEIEQQAGADALDKIDKDYLDQYIRSQALNRAFTERAAAAAGKDQKPYTDEERTAQKDALYEQNYAEPLCLNAVQSQTQEEAAAAKERIDSGDDFGKVAQDVAAAAGASIPDTGLVVCIPPDEASAAFNTDFTAVAVGDIIGPVEYQSASGTSFLVLKVEATDGLSREDAEPYLDAQVPTEPDAIDPTSYDSSAELAALFDDADIDVNPQFGRWSPAQTKVVPPVIPADPTASTEPKGAAETTTTLATAGS